MTRPLSAGAGVVLALAVAAGPAGAEGIGNDEPVGPGKVGFAADFPVLTDHEWGFPIGGFGGAARGAPVEHVPVIFVHGNNVDAADWYPVREDFRAAGWTDQELWALSYNGLGGDNGSVGAARPNPEAEAEHAELGHDGRTRVTSNEPNVADLYDFLVAVRAYTGSDRFSIVAHSLGVTLARRTLKEHAELRPDLVAFVGIAGANHGTSFCPPGSEGVVNSCDEIAAGTQWLADLNGTDGSDETYRPARWLTVSDGSGQADIGYAGPAYAASPQLVGADNRTYELSHNDLRLDPEVVAEYRTFLEEVETPVLTAGDGDGVGGGVAPAAPNGGVGGGGVGGGVVGRPSGSGRSPAAAAGPAGGRAAEAVESPSAAVTEAAAPAVGEVPLRSPALPSVPVVASGRGPEPPGRYRAVLVGIAAVGLGLWRLNERFWPRGRPA